MACMAVPLVYCLTRYFVALGTINYIAGARATRQQEAGLSNLFTPLSSQAPPRRSVVDMHGVGCKMVYALDNRRGPESSLHLPLHVVV
mmetsp:Transcript_56269/g.47450  ORF Transcript_56269/g.47450 Transcript_56269/m.47450 type:complete len:88 (-) Transcript_56269:396-659(-)